MAEITCLGDLHSVLVEYGICDRRSTVQSLFSTDFKFKDIYFRGQAAKYPTIISGLPRVPEYIENEYLMYHETKKEKAEEFKEFHTPIEDLSKMQHYGMPTRLIDFTVNPLIALFFAIQDEYAPEDAIIYVYKGCGRDIDDMAVKVKSVLPILPCRPSAGQVAEQLKTHYGIELEEDEILKFVNQTTFIKFTDDLIKTNIRLYNQRGTFAICGNEVRQGEIQSTLKDVPLGEAYLTIRISSAFRSTLKQELNERFHISDGYIYPELESWAHYIKEKYKKRNVSLDDAYSVLRKKEISIPDVRRLEIMLVLNKPLIVEDIKQIVLHITQDEQAAYDIIFIYVASNGENYTLSNWFLTGTWVSENVEEYYSPVMLSSLDKNRFSWEVLHTIEFQDYARANVFQSDKKLFLIFYHTFQTLYKIFHSLSLGYELLDDIGFADEVDKHSLVIRTFTERAAYLNRSRDNNFDSFLCDIKDFILALDELVYWIKLPNSAGSWKDYRINRCFRRASNFAVDINDNKKRWMELLGITEEDLSESGYKEVSHSLMQFKQSIPLSENPLIVEFSLEYDLTPENLIIKGQTNLYDDARLNLILNYKHSGFLSQQDTYVKDGQFQYLIPRELLKQRNYQTLLTLSFPRTQEITFVDWAGEEYENLSGPFVEHNGIDSTLAYMEYFDLKHMLEQPSKENE